MDLVAARELDAVDSVDHIPEQVAIHHSVHDTLEDRGDHVPAVDPVRALQAAEVRKETRPACAIWPHGFIVVYECDEFAAGDPIWTGRPVAPAIRSLDRWSKAPTSDNRLVLS